jgi:hypothetical protein
MDVFSLLQSRWLTKPVFVMCGIKGTFPKNTSFQLGECEEIQYSMNPMEQEFMSIGRNTQFQ